MHATSLWGLAQQINAVDLKLYRLVVQRGFSPNVAPVRWQRRTSATPDLSPDVYARLL
jgi:hypothetical protein